MVTTFTLENLTPPNKINNKFMSKNDIKYITENNKEKVKLLGSSLYKSNIQEIHNNAFIRGFGLAFAHHYRLVLSPCAIWQVILFGFQVHMRETDIGDTIFIEEVVNGKKNGTKTKLKVRRDTFCYDNADNPWHEVFGTFCEQIHNLTKDKTLLNTIESNFSTSGITELGASHITLMAAAQDYFEYELYTKCGIPEITLLGTEKDWILLYQKTEKLLSEFTEKNFGKKWFYCLGPVLQEFIKSAQGKPNKTFWKKAYKLIEKGKGSGSYHFVSGWVNIFFPYLHYNDTFIENEFMVSWQKTSPSYGPKPSCFPSTTVEAPVKWFYYEQELDITFQAGTIGLRIGITDDYSEIPAVQPIVGWSVIHKLEQTQKTKKSIINLENTKKRKISIEKKPFWYNWFNF